MEFDYDEEFFSGFDLTLEIFLFFLNTLKEYTIYSLVFEIESGIWFKIEEDTITVSLKQGKLKDILKVMSKLLAVEDNTCCQKVIKNQGRYVYFKNTTTFHTVSKSEMWNKFDSCIN